MCPKHLRHVGSPFKWYQSVFHVCSTSHSSLWDVDSTSFIVESAGEVFFFNINVNKSVSKNGTRTEIFKAILTSYSHAHIYSSASSPFITVFNVCSCARVRIWPLTQRSTTLCLPSTAINGVCLQLWPFTISFKILLNYYWICLEVLWLTTEHKTDVIPHILLGAKTIPSSRTL